MADKGSTNQIALMGIMLGVIFVITILENIFFMPVMPPNIRPGLANIVIMYCVFSIGRRQALILNILKSLFVLVTRGAIAGFLSLSGGILSVMAIIWLAGFKKKQLSYGAISVSGAITHNLGQFAVVMILTATPALIYYIPVLIISGVVSGLITGTLLKILLPALNRI